MRHHVGGKAVHVPPRQIVRKDAELKERHENAEAGALAHSLDARQYRFRATDQRGTALDQAFGGGLAAAQPPAHADEVLHRADRGVAGRHQHLETLAQEIVEQRLDRPPGFLARSLVRLSDIDWARPAKLIRPRLVAVLPRLFTIAVVVPRDEVARRECHQERVLALRIGCPSDRLARPLRRNPDRWMRGLVWPRPEVDIPQAEMVAVEGEGTRLRPGPDDQIVRLVETLVREEWIDARRM